MSVNVGQAVGYLMLDTSSFKLGLKNAKKDLDGFKSSTTTLSQKVSALGGAMTSVGSSMTKWVTVPIAAARAAVIKSGIDFETAFTGVKKTVDATDKQLDELRQGILDMSKEMPESAEEIAGVAEAAGQLGIKTDDILSFTKVMVQLGDTTNLSSQEAATALAKFANITKMSADDYDNLGAVIVDLGNNFATTEADIVQLMTRLASTGEIVGLSEPQMAALATTLSSLGIEAEAGGTAISKLLKMLEVASKSFPDAKAKIDATGFSLQELKQIQDESGKRFKQIAWNIGLTSDELKTAMSNVQSLENFASAAGVSAEEFNKAYGEDAVKALGLFISGLNDTERNGKSAVEILEGMGITEVRLSNAILAMSTSEGLLTSALDTANQAWDENTALQKEAEQRYGTVESNIEILKNKLNALGVTLSDNLLPSFHNFVVWIGNIIDKFSQMSPTAQKVIITIASIVAAIGPLLLIGGKLLIFGTQLAKAISIVRAAILAINPIMLGSVGAIGIIIAAIVAVIAIFKYLWDNCEGFRNFWINLWNGIKDAFWKVINFIKENWQGLLLLLVNPLAGIFKLLYDNCDGFREFIQNFVESIIKFFTETIPKFFTETLPGWFEALPEKLGYLLGQLIAKIVLFFVDAWNSIKQFGIDCWTWITVDLPLIIGGIINWFKELPGRIWEWLVNTFNRIKEWGINLKNKAVEIGKSFVDKIIEFFASLPGKMKNKWDEIVAWLKGLPAEMKQKGKDIMNGLFDGLKDIWQSIKDWFSNRLNDIKGFFTGVEKGYSDTMESAREVDGSHANGLDYVPYNGYIAKLHKGERVLTAQEAKNYNSSRGDTYNFYSPKAIDEVEAARLLKKTKREMEEGFD